MKSMTPSQVSFLVLLLFATPIFATSLLRLPGAEAGVVIVIYTLALAVAAVMWAFDERLDPPIPPALAERLWRFR